MIELGVLLAGGRGRRLGGIDKASLKLGETLFHDVIIGKLSTSCQSIVVVAPEKPAWADAAGVGFCGDALSATGAPLGPAGGLLGALRYLQDCFPNGRMFTAPVDAPFFPPGLAVQLAAAQGAHPGAVAQIKEQLHPVFGVWSASALSALERLVVEGHEKAMHRIVERLGAKIVDIQASEDEFLNVNTSEDLERAQSLIDRAP